MFLKKRMYYCKDCNKAYLKSLFESIQCDSCRENCEVIFVPYPAATVLSWAILIAFAVFFFMYRDISDTVKFSLFIAAIIAYFILALIGVDRLKKRGAEIGRNSQKRRKDAVE
jgi:hypothetical protein